MEQIKDDFKRDYNLAVKSFNKKDYTSFFRNIRPCIELLGKLIIYDILGESNAIGLIDGETSIDWRRETKTYKIIEYPPYHKPTGREFCELVPQVYYCKYSDVLTTSRRDDNKKRLRRGLDSCAATFSRYYSIASEFGSHTGNTDMNAEVQAISCATFFIEYYDFLKSYKILSASTLSFLINLDTFQYDDPKVLEESKQKIDGLIKELENKETTLLLAQMMQAESEQQRLEAEQRTTGVEAQLEILQKQIAELQEQLSQQPQVGTNGNEETEPIEEKEGSIYVNQDALHFREIMRSRITDWDVEEDTMDDDQLDLIEYNKDKSMLVAGCAGSGKSVIAMHKAEQLYSEGMDVILIVYTKSLNGFMRVGKQDSSFRFYYYYQWKKNNMPKADYIIVDEIQDFTREEIQEFINAAKKHYFFFGDTAQSIYRKYGKQTMTIAQIADMTGLNTLQLFNNYRLPRPVAKITQDYVGVDVQEYNEKVYQNKETELPHFVHVNSEDEEFKAIRFIITSNPDKSIGILYCSNESVLQLSQQMIEQGIPCEFKYNIKEGDCKYVDSLNFNTFIPKIMTYHSAKGLQFDIVILPGHNGSDDTESKKALYVAMTRTMHKLYVLYSTLELMPPLNVPSHLYIKTL